MRTEYTAMVGQPDMAESVRRMMKEQHKHMFLALRAGEFDELIERQTSGPSTPKPEASVSDVPRMRESELPGLSFGAGEAKTMPGLSTLVIEPAANTGALAATNESVPVVSASPRPPQPSPPPPARESAARLSVSGLKRASVRPRKTKSSLPPAPRRARVVDDPTPTDLPETKPTTGKNRPSERPSRKLRPPTATQQPIDPHKQSIFGEAAAGRQTLDEVILSFLEDDEET
jgi:hypothetical protein